MINKTNILQILIILCILFTHTLKSEELPFKPHPEFKQYHIKFEPYYTMGSYKSGAEIYGHYWEAKFKKETSTDREIFFSSVEKLNDFKLLKKSGQRRYYKRDKFLILISFHGKWYQVKIVRETPYPKILKLTDGKNLKYKNSKITRVPSNSLIPEIDGYIVERSRYKKFDKLLIRYKTPERKLITSSPEGNYWEIHYRNSIKNSNNNRYQLIHNLRDEIVKKGGKILEERGSNLVIKYKDDRSVIWGVAKAYQNTVNIKFLKEDKFVQSLKIDPDELKAELDRTGKVTLEGIYFDTNKATLKEESKPAIDAAVTLLNKYPDLKLMIKGHTDNTGTPSHNMKLSDNRAASVKAAIIKGGIDSIRLQSKGYGETNPIASNDTEEGRAQNRRVELSKTGGGKAKAIIDIDFIKPMPGAKETARRKYDKRVYKVNIKKGRKIVKSLEISGPSVTVWYRFINNDKSINKEVSRTEVVRNYKNALKLLGAIILREDKNTLFFKIEDRGDGKKLYGRVDAYNASYTVQLYVDVK